MQWTSDITVDPKPTYYMHYILYAFWLHRWNNHMTPMFESSMAEFQKVAKAYYSTVEGFLTSDPLLLNLRRVADHMKRERDVYVFGGGGVLDWKNGEACGDTLMNGHWEELIGKVEELLHATHDPDNYCMHIRAIIQFSSDGLQRLKSFLRLHDGGCDDIVVNPPPHWLYIAFSLLLRSWVQILHLHSVGLPTPVRTPLSAPSEL